MKTSEPISMTFSVYVEDEERVTGWYPRVPKASMLAIIDDRLRQARNDVAYFERMLGAVAATPEPSIPEEPK